VCVPREAAKAAVLGSAPPRGLRATEDCVSKSHSHSPPLPCPHHTHSDAMPPRHRQGSGGGGGSAAQPTPLVRHLRALLQGSTEHGEPFSASCRAAKEELLDDQAITQMKAMLLRRDDGHSSAMIALLVLRIAATNSPARGAACK